MKGVQLMSQFLTASAITPEMLSPLTEGITANVGVILPACIGIFSIFLGIRLIPALINRFCN